jgi:hypothetical protein
VQAHLRGEETSLNPLSMMEALIGAMQHSAVLAGPASPSAPLAPFSKHLQASIHAQMTTPGKVDRLVRPAPHHTMGCHRSRHAQARCTM